MATNGGSETPPRPKLDLNRLGDGFPCITEAEGRRLAEAGAVCLEDRGHKIGTTLTITGHITATCELNWPSVHDQMKRSLADMQEATELGACGIAISIVTEYTEYHVVERARKRTGIDYWLSLQDDGELSFAARLEVSGTLSGGEPEIRKRTKRKVDQTKRSDGELPAYVVVVEFSLPAANVVKR